MKILVFSPYYPPHIGGLESHAEEFNKHFSKLTNSSITVFTPLLPTNSANKEKVNPNITIIRYPAFEIIPNYPLPKFWSFQFWRLFFNLYQKSFNLVISRTRFFCSSFIALIYAKAKGIKFIHIEHGSDFVRLNSRLKNLIAKIYDHTLGRMVLKFSDLNISISTSVKNFIKKFDQRPSPIIRRGIDKKEIFLIPANRKLKEKYTDKIIIGFVGRLIDGKGVSDLITALSKIKKQNFICLIIGEGPQKKALKKITAELNLEKKIIFLGQLRRKKTLSVMKTIDIFVNPSYSEGLPTAVLEAGLCQKAIIATDVGGTKEIIQNNKSGYLIKPKDISSLTKRLENLIKKPELRKKFGRSAEKYIQKTFSWEKSIQKYEKEFAKIMAKK